MYCMACASMGVFLNENAAARRSRDTPQPEKCSRPSPQSLRIQSRRLDLRRAFPGILEQLLQLRSQLLRLLYILLAARKIGELVWVVALVIELPLKVGRALRFLRSGDIGHAVGPLRSANCTCGHGLADLD